MEFTHIPVLLEQCMQGLAIKPDGVYIDGTAGGAGHSGEIAKRLQTGRLLAFDKDPDAVAIATQRLSPYPCAEVVHADFSEIPEVLAAKGIPAADGILLDLGVSSHQLDKPERGFSYNADAPLDMRMSQSGLSAYDVVNSYSAKEITHILRVYGEERFAPRIASRIVQAREKAPIATTLELAEIIKQAIPAAARSEAGHPAKRSFQAIRIAVNGELESLAACLEKAFECLAPGGRFVIITFHSLEDRMVKQSFAAFCRGCTCPPDFPICVCGNTPRAKAVTKKPLTATPEELAVNRRSKPAKLRVIERV